MLALYALQKKVYVATIRQTLLVIFKARSIVPDDNFAQTDRCRTSSP
jgi:hypothetical protein